MKNSNDIYEIYEDLDAINGKRNHTTLLKENIIQFRGYFIKLKEIINMLNKILKIPLKIIKMKVL